MGTRWQRGETEGPRRADAAERSVYEELCDEALDYYESGDAQRRHLRAHLINRYGEQAEPRKAASSSTEVVTELSTAETDDARTIREGRLELITAPLVRSIVDSVAVLYSADDLERRYLAADRTPDANAKAVIAYHHERARLGPYLQSVDAYVSLLGSCCLLLRWCAPRRCVSYSIVWPHAVKAWEHPEWRFDPALAYGIAYREAGTSRDGTPVWACYIRPPLAIDAKDAPTQAYPKGRFVRFARKGEPFPPPVPGGPNGAGAGILTDVDNPLVVAGGMEGGRLLWSPLVWHHARPPVETLHPAPASDLVGANREIDLALSWAQYLANTQSHGQGVLKGPGRIKRLGPGSIVHIDDTAGSFSFEVPGADVAGVLEAAQKQMQIQALLRHLSPDMYSLTRPSIQTGPAKLIEQHALIEARWRRTLVADGWEADRFDLERLLHNAYGKPTGLPSISWETRQSVRWGELRVPVDRTAQVARLLSEIAARITSRTDAAMEVYGFDRDEAKRHLRDVDEELATAEAPGAPPAPASGAEPVGDAVAAADASPEGQREPEPGAVSAPDASAATTPAEGGASMTEDDRKSLEFIAKMFEVLVKAKAPPEVTRALVEQMATRLGVASDAVKGAIDSATFEWYATPPEQPGAGAEEQ